MRGRCVFCNDVLQACSAGKQLAGADWGETQESYITARPALRTASMPKGQKKRATGSGFCLQELLLILEEYWERNPALRGVPIFQASGLAQKALTVYQTYIEMMNDAIKAAFQVGASELACSRRLELDYFCLCVARCKTPGRHSAGGPVRRKPWRWSNDYPLIALHRMHAPSSISMRVG